MIIKHKGHIIKIYDDIQLLPILRYQKFNKFVMMSNEIGNTFDDYDQRTAKTLQLLKTGMVDESIQEILNRRQTVFNAYNEYSPTNYALGCMIYQIDDTKYHTTKENTIETILQHLDRIGFNYKQSLETLTNVKKKSNFNWKNIFRIILKKGKLKMRML